MQTAAMKKYREEHPMCEHHAFFFHRLNVPAEELHHIEGRSVDDESNFIMLCRDCHRNAEAEVRLYQSAHLYYKNRLNHAPDFYLELPWQMIPASRPRSAVKNGKLIVYTESEYRKFKRDIATACKLKEFEKGCAVKIDYTAPDWRGLDIDNCEKGILDAISKADNRITTMLSNKTVTTGQPYIKISYWR